MDNTVATQAPMARIIAMQSHSPSTLTCWQGHECHLRIAFYPGHDVAPEYWKYVPSLGSFHWSKAFEFVAVNRKYNHCRRLSRADGRREWYCEAELTIKGEVGTRPVRFKNYIRYYSPIAKDDWRELYAPIVNLRLLRVALPPPGNMVHRYTRTTGEPHLQKLSDYDNVVRLMQRKLATLALYQNERKEEFVPLIQALDGFYSKADESQRIRKEALPFSDHVAVDVPWPQAPSLEADYHDLWGLLESLPLEKLRPLHDFLRENPANDDLYWFSVGRAVSELSQYQVRRDLLLFIQGDKDDDIECDWEELDSDWDDEDNWYGTI